MQWDQYIGRRLKLRDLYILMTVVEAGSMGKAAARLNMSQPAISTAISELERTLGQRLLNRSRQGAEPTPYGQALIKRGVAVFDELKAGLKDLEHIADPAVGEVRIGIPAHATGFIAAIIDRLSRRHPRLAFRVSIADTAASTQALEERKVDLVFVHFIRPIAEERMSIEILCEDPHVVAVAADSPWTRRRKVRLADLVDEPWAMPAPDSPLGSMVANAFQAHGLDVPATSVVAPLPVRYPLLATGRFLTMVPRFALAFPAHRPALKALPIELPTTRRPFGIITLKNRAMSAAAQLFVEHAREVVKPLADGR
jgi:DNA-binding transcriptional LysR family regulator